VVYPANKSDVNGLVLRPGNEIQSEDHIIGVKFGTIVNTMKDNCEKFGKTGFITKMDYDSNIITFECRKQARS
jgi:hypothetical protein